MKRRITLWCMAAILFIPVITLSQPYADRLGVEAPGDVFVDIVKQGYRWDKPNGSGGWTALTTADVDAQGWPRTDVRYIVDFRPVAEWVGQIDDPDAYRVNRSGVYKATFTGQATLTPIEGPFTISNQTYNPTLNTTTFDITIGAPGPQHGLVVFSFTNTKRTTSSATGTGITNFKLIRPGYPANATQVFTNEFISTLTNARFSIIRFMGVTNTNNNIEWGPTSTLLQSWSNRKQTTDASQTDIFTLNKKDGWAWEYVIQLCNQANMDLWVNIPVSVDDNYITQLATLVKNNLNPSLKVYIEHTNELWNFGFTQYSWNKARAVEEVNAGGSNFNYDGSTDQEVWNQRRHSKRLRDAVTIFGGVFGAGTINTRIRGILAGVTPDPGGFFIGGRLPGMLQYLQANYGDPKNYVYAISIPLYYGGEAAAGNGSTGGYSVDQILTSMQQVSDNDVPNRQAVVTLANNYQLPGGFVSYEGGPDIGGGNTTNIGNRIRAMRDPRMADLYKRNFANNFWDIGGNIAMQFALQSPYTRYGAWGLTDDINIPDRNSLFQAARDLIGTGGGPNPGTGTGLRGEYFNNRTLTAPSVLTRTEAVNFDWSNGSPASGTVGTDNFSVRWTGQVEAPVTGSYVFSTTSDDGIRLYVNGSLAINNWTDHPPTTNSSAAINLTAGQKYSITMEFYEAGGGAVAKLLWNYPGQSQQPIPQSRLYLAATTGTGLQAQYFNNRNFTSPAALTRTDATVDFNWAGGSPQSGTVNTDQFTVRWSGQVEAPVAGNYTFTTVSDDGVRLYVNGSLVINNFTDHASTTDNSAPISLTAGQKYNIVMEYYEAGGNAEARLRWSYPGQATQTIPQARLFPSTFNPRTAQPDLVLRPVVQEEGKELIVYPNPVRSGNLTVRVYAERMQEASISLMSVSSRAIATYRRTLQPGVNYLSLPVNGIAGGTYFVVVNQGGNRMVRKVVVNK